MGFTQPGQAQASLIKQVEQEVNYLVEERSKDRQDLAAHPVVPGADAWQQGKIYQIRS